MPKLKSGGTMVSYHQYVIIFGGQEIPMRDD